MKLQFLTAILTSVFSFSVFSSMEPSFTGEPFVETPRTIVPSWMLAFQIDHPSFKMMDPVAREKIWLSYFLMERSIERGEIEREIERASRDRKMLLTSSKFKVPKTNRILTVVFELKNITADKMKSLLSEFNTVHLTVMPKENSLVITGSGNVLREIEEIIEVRDIEVL